MLYTIPDYYKEFTCIADQCEDTCCAGWQIVIDKKSLKRYWNERHIFGKRLRRSIQWRQGVFRQSKDKRCAFLNENNLCDLYANLGAKSLCKTCRLYPRHIEEFEGVREISLSLSCPEVARILLKREEPVRFLSYEKEGEEEYEDFDFILYSKLADARDLMLGFLQDRTLDIKVRAGLTLGMAHDMQVCINKQNVFGCEGVFERYQPPKAAEYVGRRVGAEDAKTSQEHYKKAYQRFRKLYKLELLREDWQVQLWETEDILYKKGAEHYQTVQGEFAEWLQIHLPNWTIISEQLLVYFIHTYFCGAVYDGRVYAKAAMAIDSVFLLYEMLAARWKKNEEYLDMEDIVELVYRYSREVEHSDENLVRMERLVLENGSHL